jgi:uncharacterized protein YecE (DUF72 family)
LKYLIGAGGWAYFPAESKSRLQVYAENFNFVEVNYTFYNYPNLRRVESWRKAVPEDFTFSVRCHQDLTHKIGLKPTSEAYQVLNQMIAYCKTLEAPYLLMETPSSFRINAESISDAKKLFADFDLKGVRLVWESRGQLTAQALEFMQDMNIVQAVDLSKKTPLFQSDTIYTRLFGKGQHNIYQFTDAELEEIGHKVLKSEAKTATLSYHDVRMYSDALRFAHYKKTGSFPSITPFVGVESAKSVLAEDARFPITKKDLIDDQGWKVFDATKNVRIHLSEWLQEIPDKVYVDLKEVARELEEKHNG